MRRLFTLLLTAVVCLAASAQTVDEQKKKIASIKKSSSYIYAEVTTTDQQQAIDLATNMLHKNVNEWAAKQKKFSGSNKIVTRNTNYAIEQITMPRANMYRAFMYVKKTDIIPADNVEVMNTFVSDTGVSNAVVSELLAVKNTGQLSAKLQELKKNGQVKEYDNLRGLKDKDQTEYIMVVFNREGVVEAVLSEGADRTNLATGSPDQLTNYKGCGAIGVKVNN